jgi:phosphopantothenoylcysteine decarboxylase/phosphopantothenate--cysteine ligase
VKIVLGVSGGIAAYKAPELVRRLQDGGADVRVILTPNAARFVSALSLAAVSNHPVLVDQWGDPSRGGVDHIEMARWAELLLIAPATANIIAKLAVGIADDALSTYAVAHRGALMIAPAMNTFMLSHPTVIQNIATLKDRGVHIVEPDSGLLACGDEGEGRMPDPPVIAEHVKQLLQLKDLSGKKILITAGPTREPIDPVRFVSNRSSGKMGYALAEAAQKRGAAVTLVSGPTSLPVPAGVDVASVSTAQEMYRAVLDRMDGQDVIIKAAAVADYAPADPVEQKIKKQLSGEELMIRLRRTPDILEEVSRRKNGALVVAFAAETQAVADNAREKLQRKGADLVVANDVSDRSIGFDADENEVLVIGTDGSSVRIEKAPKLIVANRILDLIVEAMNHAP